MSGRPSTDAQGTENPASPIGASSMTKTPVSAISPTLRVGVREAVAAPAVRGLVLVVAALTGLDALEEYFTLVAAGLGRAGAMDPAGRAGHPAGRCRGHLVDGPPFADRRRQSSPGVLASALGARRSTAFGCPEWFGRPAGLAGVAVFYGLYRVVLVAVNTRLQDAITGPARATVNSVAGLLSELAAIAIYGLWALDGLCPIAALILLLAVVMPLAMRGRADLRLCRVSGTGRGAAGARPSIAPSAGT